MVGVSWTTEGRGSVVGSHTEPFSLLVQWLISCFISPTAAMVRAGCLLQLPSRRDPRTFYGQVCTGLSWVVFHCESPRASSSGFFVLGVRELLYFHSVGARPRICSLVVCLPFVSQFSWTPLPSPSPVHHGFERAVFFGSSCCTELIGHIFLKW